MSMRHVRILNYFMSSILPASPFIQLTTKRPCLNCSSWTHYNKGVLGTLRYYSDNAPTKKYSDIHVNSRPAEPSIAIRKLSQQGRPNEALSIYLKLLSEGGFPSQESLYQLTRALYKSDNLLGMYTIHDTLISYYNHHLPSKRSSRSMIYMYTMLIQLVTKSTTIDMNTIYNLCHEMQRFSTGKISIVFYNTLLKTLLQQNQLVQAKALFHELKKQHIQPTIVTYGILMKDASRRRDVTSLLNYLDEIEKDHLSPDYAIVSILVTTLCDMHEFDRAKGFIEKLHTMKADHLLGTKYRLQLLKTIEQRRKKYNNKKKKKSQHQLK